MKLYIVHGSTGEYSDHRSWTVAAYKDEAMAQAHVKAALDWVEKNVDPNASYSERDKYKNPFDPRMSIDYTGVDWTLGWVELRTKLPSAKAPMTAEAE